jgi:hypothetical protein
LCDTELRLCSLRLAHCPQTADAAVKVIRIEGRSQDRLRYVCARQVPFLLAFHEFSLNGTEIAFDAFLGAGSRWIPSRLVVASSVRPPIFHESLLSFLLLPDFIEDLLFGIYARQLRF